MSSPVFSQPNPDLLLPIFVSLFVLSRTLCKENSLIFLIKILESLQFLEYILAFSESKSCPNPWHRTRHSSTVSKWSLWPSQGFQWYFWEAPIPIPSLQCFPGQQLSSTCKLALSPCFWYDQISFCLCSFEHLGTFSSVLPTVSPPLWGCPHKNFNRLLRSIRDSYTWNNSWCYELSWVPRPI